jgi:hypothetical protein
MTRAVSVEIPVHKYKAGEVVSVVRPNGTFLHLEILSYEANGTWSERNGEALVCVYGRTYVCSVQPVSTYECGTGEMRPGLILVMDADEVDENTTVGVFSGERVSPDDENNVIRRDSEWDVLLKSRTALPKES